MGFSSRTEAIPSLARGNCLQRPPPPEGVISGGWQQNANGELVPGLFRRLLDRVLGGREAREEEILH